MKSDVKEELRLVDLSDDAVKEFLGYHFSAKRRLEAAQKDDPEIQQMREQLKLYIMDNYGEEIKACEARIKAGWAQINARGLKYKLPEGK